MRSIVLSLLFTAALPAQFVDHAALATDLSRQIIELRAKQAAPAVDQVSRKALEHAELAGDPLILAKCLHNRALILRELHLYKEAEPLHRRVLSILQSSKEDPVGIAISYQSLASLLHFLNRQSEAEQFLRSAVALPLQNHPLTLALILNTLGQVQYALGRDREAEAIFKRAINAQATIGKSFANTPKGNEFYYTLVPGETEVNLLALILNNQGLVSYRLRQFKEAEKCWRRSISLYRQQPGKATGVVAAPIANLGELLRLQKRLPEAVEQLTEALSLFEVTLGSESFRVASVLNLLGNTLAATGDLTKARQHYDRSLATIRKLAGEEHHQIGVILSNIAELEVRQGASARALELYTRSLDILEKSLGLTHPQLIPTLTGQASLLKKLGRSKDAKRIEARRNSIQAVSARPGMVSLEDLQNGR